MATQRPRTRLDRNEIAAGEIITVRTLLSHVMESGQRRDDDGNPIPRKIINTFTCAFEGDLVFACDIEPAVSANPYFQFTVAPPRSGTLTFTWLDDDGTEITATEDVVVV